MKGATIARLHRLLASACLWSCVTCVAAAEPPDVAALMNSLAQVEWVKAEYVESVETYLLDNLIDTRGQLEYRAPDQISKVSSQGDSVTIRGDSLIIETKGQSRTLAVSDHEAVQTLVLALQATFAGDLVALRNAFGLAYDPADNGWTLSLTPLRRERLGGLDRIDMRGSGVRIDRVEIIESNGDRRTLVLRTLQREPEIVRTPGE